MKIRYSCPRCGRKKMKMYIVPVGNCLVELKFHCKKCGWIKCDEK